MNQGTGINARRSRGIWRERLFYMVALIIFLLPLALTPSPHAHSAEKWPGVDESVVEKYANEHGREARTPFINTDQGDLLLFVFLLAGTVGGFMGGYYWRVLIVEKASGADKGKQADKA